MVFAFLELPAQVCVALSATGIRAYKALYWLCGAIPLIFSNWGIGATVTPLWLPDRDPVTFKSGTSLYCSASISSLSPLTK